MGYVVQQKDIETIKQPQKTLYVRAELLNRDFVTIEQLEGELIRDDYSIDANSDVRRTYNVDFVVKDSTYLVERGVSVK